MRIFSIISLSFTLIYCGEAQKTPNKTSSISATLINGLYYDDPSCTALKDTYKSQSLNLIGSPQVPHAALKKLEKILNSKDIETTITVKEAGLSLTDSTSDWHVKLDFSYDNIPFCHTTGGIHGLKNFYYISGRLPQNFQPLVLNHEIFKTIKKDQLNERLLKIGFTNPNVLNFKNCLLLENNSPKEAVLFEIEDNNLPYQVTLSESNFYHLEKKFFDLAVPGSLSYAIEGSGDFPKYTTSTMDFNDLSEGGTICNPKFKVILNPADVSQAFSKTHEFIYSLKDSMNFYQANTFVNANIHANWFLTLPNFKAWIGPQVTISMKTDTMNKNTSHYIPKSGDSPPLIEFGNGDGISLQNLWLDPDVVSHELGHHIIFSRALKDMSDRESVVIHEGLADFFVFARTKNPCLARSICPTGGHACSSSTCLRRGDTDMKISDQSRHRGLVHLIGQVVSGMLWELGKTENNDPIKTANLVYKSLDFLDPNAGYFQLIVALAAGSVALTQNTSECEAIKTFAVTRELISESDKASISCQKMAKTN